ncbi:MAG: hypothetical protein Q7S26_00390 [bacterium]|nr:hypothetical protein [bacterium]
MNFLYGDIVEAPKGFAPPESWPEYGAVADPLGFCAREQVGENPSGVRWAAWPLCFEEYVGDTEPNLEASKTGMLARNRMVGWKRISRTHTEPGWHTPSRKPWRIDGWHTLVAGEDYTKNWFKNARREARLWREDFLGSHYTVEDISIEEFADAYKKSTAAQKTDLTLLKVLLRKQALPKIRKHILLWGVRDIETGRIVAGTAVITSPTYKSSVRFCPFMLAEARNTYASTGLVDHWFGWAQKKNIQYMLFTCFWQPGDPVGWKGPAEFKSHFGLQYVAYPPFLTRFVHGKIF